jgi:hypothetical protein
MIITTTLQANQAEEYQEESDFFRLLDTVGPVQIIFYSAGREVSRAEDVGEGYAEKFNGGTFDKIRILSTTTQSVHFVTRLGNEVAYDKPPTGSITGSVTVTNFPGTQPVSGTVAVSNQPAVQGAFIQAQKTVTNVSTSILAARAARRYLLIQNNDAAGIVYINLTGATAAAASGIKIEPGGSYEVQGFCPNAAITAIGSIASNANVIAVEA